MSIYSHPVVIDRWSLILTWIHDLLIDIYKLARARGLLEMLLWFCNYNVMMCPLINNAMEQLFISLPLTPKSVSAECCTDVGA
jgi:hypothetical protein